jgi:hypothetical protein
MVLRARYERALGHVPTCAIRSRLLRNLRKSAVVDSRSERAGVVDAAHAPSDAALSPSAGFFVGKRPTLAQAGRGLLPHEGVH